LLAGLVAIGPLVSYRRRHPNPEGPLDQPFGLMEFPT